MRPSTHLSRLHPHISLLHQFHPLAHSCPYSTANAEHQLCPARVSRGGGGGGGLSRINHSPGSQRALEPAGEEVCHATAHRARLSGSSRNRESRQGTADGPEKEGHQEKTPAGSDLQAAPGETSARWPREKERAGQVEGTASYWHGGGKAQRREARRGRCWTGSLLPARQTHGAERWP